MDKQAFARAAAKAADGAADSGIGTRNESPLHAALKLYFEPRCAFREVPVDGYIVDIKNEAGTSRSRPGTSSSSSVSWPRCSSTMP